MKTATLTINLSAKVPKGNAYGTIEFNNKTYLAMAEDEGPAPNEYESEAGKGLTLRGGLVVGNYELYPVNKLTKDSKIISIGLIWNREWGLFETNIAFVELKAYINKIREENLAETAEERGEILNAVTEDLAKISGIEIEAAAGASEYDEEELADIAEEKAKLQSQQGMLVSFESQYQPQIEIIVE